MYITRELPNNEYQAAVNANSPTALNPFATISDLPGASNWQSVMSAGSAAIGITSSVLLDVEDNFITFDSNDTGTGNSASIILDGTSGSENTYIGLATGGGLQALNILPGSATYFDLTNSKGLVYAGDYSAAGILDDRWIPDYGAVKALIAGGSNGIYGGSDFLSVSTTVSLTDGAAANYDLTFATLTEAALVHFDAANNRIGFGTAAPGHPLHFASGNAYFQNGSVAVGTTVPDASHKFRVSTDNADGNNYTTARFDLGYDAATGAMQGVQIRSTTTLSGTSSTLYGVNSNITGSASAGTHTVIAGRFRAAKTQGGTSTVTNYALQLEDGTEGTIGYVLAAATVNGHTNWVDVNTLVSGVSTLYTANGTVGSGREATITDTLTFKGGDFILQGASLATEVFFDYSANCTVFGTGTADAAYSVKTYGGVNLDNGLATFNKTPVSNRNISITTQGLATNGTGMYVSNAQTLAGDITVGHFIASGATTTNTALSLRAINGGVNNALSIIAGDISVRQNTTKVLFGVTGFLANTRFALINEGTFTTGFDVYSNKTGDNTGYSARGSSASSVGGNQFGFKANNGTGAANNTYAFHGTISAGGSTANTANVYGYYLDWNGPGATRTATGLQKGLYFDMRLTAAATETISGDIFGTDILLGTGHAADSIGNITGHKIRFLDTASSTITKAVGLELDFTSSLATTKYGIILAGSANSGFGVTSPASMVTVNGDIEVIGGANGFIYEDRTTTTRYRAYIDNNNLLWEVVV